MANNTTAAAIVVEPSQHWEGNDGPWSTFNINVGTPSQPTRVLISSASGEVWVISANKTQGGCIGQNAPSSCPQDRGALINVNSSSTWQDQGLFGVGLEVNLPDYINNYDVADYGLETVGLGLPGSNGVTEPNLVVGALATKDFFLGYLGVTNHPTNFTEFDDPHPSLLSTLRTQNKIPSLSYAYSAGAPYRFKKVEGTLTLGGYDASRFTPNNASFKFASDISRDLVLGLQSISYSDSGASNRNLLPEGILTFVDSTVPHIWLPQDACTLFEDAFGITYNETVQRYLVNDTTHQKLQSQNPSISFILGNDVTGGSTVNVTLPYAAFDLEVGYPIVNDTHKYFPIRRAANDSQYTLGRTFLQEAYLIVDYERSNFSISQNSWVENAQEHIVPIPSVNSTTPAVAKPAKAGISIGAIVGIIVAVVFILFIGAIAAFFVVRKRRRKRDAEKNAKDDDPFRKPEMDGTGRDPIGELYAEGKFGEVDSSSKVEMQGSQPGLSDQDKKNMAEIEGSRGGAEMEGTIAGTEMEGLRLRAEMAGDHLAPVELDAGPQGLSEMPSPNSSNSGLPSPLGAIDQRHSGPSASWNRRQAPTPRLPDSESSDLSADTDNVGKGTRASRWTGRSPRGTPRSLTPNDISSQSSSSRERRPSQSYSSTNLNTRQHRSNERLEVPSRSTTPIDVSSQSSRSRERQGTRGNAGIGPASNRLSPAGNASPRSREDRSPVPRDQSSRFIERRPSPLGNGAPRASPSPRREPSEGRPGNFF